jgi:hypothetical protein
MQLYFFEAKLPNLKLKTGPKQLLGSLLLVIALPGCTCLLSVITIIKILFMFYLKHPSFLPSADVKPILSDLVLSQAVCVFIVHIKILFVVHLKHSSF